jgi:hypothetical protein
MGQGSDGVAVRRQQGGEAGDAQSGRAAEVVRCRIRGLGVLEGGGHGVGVEPGRLGEGAVGGRLRQTEAVDVEGLLDSGGEFGRAVGGGLAKGREADLDLGIARAPGMINSTQF